MTAPDPREIARLTQELHVVTEQRDWARGELQRMLEKHAEAERERDALAEELEQSLSGEAWGAMIEKHKEAIAERDALARERDFLLARRADDLSEFQSMRQGFRDMRDERDALKARLAVIEPVFEAALKWQDPGLCIGARQCRETVDDHDERCPVSSTEIALYDAIDSALADSPSSTPLTEEEIMRMPMDAAARRNKP